MCVYIYTVVISQLQRVPWLRRTLCNEWTIVRHMGESCEYGRWIGACRGAKMESEPQEGVLGG